MCGFYYISAKYFNSIRYFSVLIRIFIFLFVFCIFIYLFYTIICSIHLIKERILSLIFFNNPFNSKCLFLYSLLIFLVERLILRKIYYLKKHYHLNFSYHYFLFFVFCFVFVLLGFYWLN